VKQASGRIGYVEYAFAVQSHIPYAQMRNKALRYVMPNVGSFAAAASGASWSPSNGFGTVLVNAAGSNSWPIAGATFALVKKNSANYTNAHTMFQWFDWACKSANGRSDASALQYVSMPTSVITAVEKVWHASVKAGGKAAW
jgi:phosphate transport system substrate-binding protein